MEIINKISGQKKSFSEIIKQGLQNIYNKYLNNKKEVWNDMYEMKYEDKMNSSEQSDRYIEIANVINRLEISNPDILDVGSGNGTLVGYIDKNNFNTFTGIDISKKAVEIGNEKYSDNPNINFLETGIFKFSGYKFDIIIFNESLYYFRINEIENVISKTMDLLNEDGTLIISMSQSLKSYLIRRKLDKILKPESDKLIYSVNSGNKWRIRVYKNLRSQNK